MSVWRVKDPKRAVCWGCQWGFTFGSALGEGLPRWPSANEFTCQCQSRRRCRFYPWAGKIPQEKEIATRSSILAWRIPWTEEPGGPQSMGSQRVGHDWARGHTHPSIALGGSGLGRLLLNLKFCHSISTGQNWTYASGNRASVSNVSQVSESVNFMEILSDLESMARFRACVQGEVSSGSGDVGCEENWELEDVSLRLGAHSVWILSPGVGML